VSVALPDDGPAVRKYLRIALILCLILAMFGGCGAFFFYRAAAHEPEFYRQAMKIEPQHQEEAGDALEQSVLELSNETRQPGHWEATFTDEQINGWLAVDLPEKFASVLPPGVESPRVAIRDGLIHIAARFKDKLVESVVSFSLQVNLTEEPNTVAVTIRKVRAGVLPVPVRQFLDRISDAARRGDIELRWSQDQGDPVAFVTIPSQHESYVHRQIFVETIEVRDGQIYLAGITDDPRQAPKTDIAQRSVIELDGANAKIQR
jgi:hypothetical protein